jgi:hypothetical protein
MPQHAPQNLPQSPPQHDAEHEEAGLIRAGPSAPGSGGASLGKCACIAAALVCAAMLAASLVWFAGQRPSTYVRATKPRVRREWRSLSPQVREKVAKAFWVMKDTSTAEGRKKYGPRFLNYDDLSWWHACVVWDPRCDQGHLGPNFITWHRAYLLMIENSLLAVDPSVLAMPYWDFSLDSAGGKFELDPERSIFSSNFFGSRDGTGDNFQVTDGLFRNWSMTEWSSERFGKSSWLAKDPANRCSREEWFQGRKAELCDRCCFSSKWRYAQPRNASVDCTCAETDTYRTTVRNHPDCTPFLNRWSKTPLAGFDGKLAGSGIVAPSGQVLTNMMGNQEYKLMYNAADFNACIDFKNTPSIVAWQACIESNFPRCGDPTSRLSQMRFQNQIVTLITRLTLPVFDAESVKKQGGLLLLDALKELAPDIELCKKNFSLYGWYDVLLEGSALKLDDSRRLDAWALKAKHFVHSMHLLIHQFVGLDFADLSSAAQDVGFFTGHHSNIDRSFAHWMHNADSTSPQWYHYPSSQINFGEVGSPKDIQEPWGVGHMALCMTPFIATDFQKAYSEYHPLRPSSPWIPGTLLEDTISSGMPFKNLFDCAEDAPTGESCTGGKRGYAHKEVLFWTHPSRTPYTYDSLEHIY